MPTPPTDPAPPRRPRWLACRLAVQMFLGYAVQGAWVPVFSSYLEQLHFTPTAAAWAFSTYSLASLVAPLLWGQIADRRVPAERCISLCAGVNAITLAAIPFLDSPAGMFLACLF